MSAMRPESISMDHDTRRRAAVDTFNYVWTLMDKADRTPQETELMIHAAHAQRFLWEDVGEAVNHARGEWQVSRAYSVAERPGPALHHGRRALEIAETNELGPFDIACGHEAIARAYAVAGDDRAAAEHVRLGRQVAETISDEEDRELIVSDLAGVPIGA